MPRVNTNNVAVAYTIESALGVAGTSWRLLEPNSIADFGATISTVARDPISRDRQRRKGSITDLDSAVGLESDLTMASFRNFIEGFCFATGENTDVTGIPSTAAAGTGDIYTVASVTAGQSPKLEVGTLLWVEGFATPLNNGLQSIGTDVVTGATGIAVTGNLTNETNASGRISLAGYRDLAGTRPTWRWSGANNQATLAKTGIGTALGNIGLIAGQVVHVGSIAERGGDIENIFTDAAGNDMFGYARVVSISNNSVVFDKTDAALQIDSDATAATLDIVFGQFIRNRSTDHVDFKEFSYQFEAAYPNLGMGGVEQYQYAVGNFCNTVGFSLPLTDKATVTFGFIGTDTGNPTGTRKSGASTAVTPSETAAFNTTADIARLRITQVDELGITTDFKSLTLNLSNNVSPEKVVGQLGAKYVNFGNFEVGLEAQLIFSDQVVIDKIRDNETVTMDFVLKNGDGVIAIDIPSMTLGGGAREFPRNESVLINTTCEAFRDSILGSSLGVSIIPVPLP